MAPFESSHVRIRVSTLEKAKSLHKSATASTFTMKITGNQLVRLADDSDVIEIRQIFLDERDFRQWWDRTGAGIKVGLIDEGLTASWSSKVKFEQKSFIKEGKKADHPIPTANETASAITSLAPDVKVYSAQAVVDGKLDEIAAAEAIYWMVKKGVKVIALHLAGMSRPVFQSVLQRAIEHAQAADVTVVSCSGHETVTCSVNMVPFDYSTIGEKDKLPSSSIRALNPGIARQMIELSSPSRSYLAGYTAGMVAMALEAHPFLTPSEIFDWLRTLQTTEGLSHLIRRLRRY
jgi:hypothetical protein